MRKGRTQKINWNEFKTTKFKLPKKVHYSQCGAYALHSITKKSLKETHKVGKKGHYSTKSMLAYLKRFGYIIKPITLGNTVEPYSIHGDRAPAISKFNVVLVDLYCYKEESTWAVLYDNKVMHSGEVGDLNPMEFFRNPLAEAYVVWHPKWKEKLTLSQILRMSI